MEQPEEYPSHLPAATASASGNSFRKPEIATSHADGDPVLPPATPLSHDTAASFSPSPNPNPVAKRPSASSTVCPDIGSSFQKFAAKLLPESISQAAVDVVCQIGRDGLMIFNSASATQLLEMYPLQNIARCDVVDSSVFELWTNNSEAQPTRIRLQSDRAGDLLDAVTAAAIELLGFTNWMYMIKHGSEEDDSMGKTVVSLGHGDGPRVGNDIAVFTRAQYPVNRRATEAIESQELMIRITGCAPVIPPYNSAATDPKDVYPLGKIIRAGEWRYLRDIIELMERGEEVKSGPYGPYSDYVRWRIESLWGTKDDAGRAKLGCILSFINYLIKFRKVQFRQCSSAGEADIPPVLFRRFSDLFIVPDTGLINSDLVRSYVLVLCLIVDDFRTDCYLGLPHQLVKSYGTDAIRGLFGPLGCQLSQREVGHTIYAELRTPLKFPKRGFAGLREAMQRRRSQPNDSKNIEQVRKRDVLWLNETTQPRPSASSTVCPDIGSSFQKFAAKLLPDSISQAAVDVVCQIGRDGLMIFDSASATQLLEMYPLQNIARCDVVDSSVFELWTNNSEAQPTRIRLQSDRAGDLLDAVTAAAIELLGFTNWMYMIKHGSEEDDSMGKTVVSLGHGDGPPVGNDIAVFSRAQYSMNRMAREAIESQELMIRMTGCAPVIPPYNSAATDPKDVYPLGKIIRAGEWRYLRDIIELMERGEEVKSGPYGPYSDYVRLRIESLWGTKDDAGRAKLGCILSFINYLIKFRKVQFRQCSSAGEADIPPVLFRRFSDLFIVPDTGLINSDLVRSYVLVLCLIVDDFRTDCYLVLPHQLVKSHGTDAIRGLFGPLGCQLSQREVGHTIYAELRTPLKFRKRCFAGLRLGMERRRRQPNDSKNIEQVRKRMRDGLRLNETAQPPRHDGVI